MNVLMKRQIMAVMVSLLFLPAVSMAADVSDGRPYSGVLKEEARKESSFIFDDGFGRLVEFAGTSSEGAEILTIRQGRQVVWQERYHVNGSHFSVVKGEGMGEIYFLIELGEKKFRAFIDRDDHWQVREILEDIRPRY